MMGRRGALAAAAASALLALAGPALAARPVVCLLPFSDSRPVKTPSSVPYKIRSENTPEPIRAHPPEGPAEVRRVVLRALQAESAIEVADLSGADPKALSGDPGLKRCRLVVGGAVFHYEGTVAVDIYGNKIYSGLVGFELVAVDAARGRRLFPPVVFAGRRQSDTVKPDDDYSSSDRQVLKGWIDEAVKVASASMPKRFSLPVAQAASR